MTEEEVKLNYITPAIENAGWTKKQIRMEYSINAGKIVVRGNIAKRLPKKKADYVLFYKENLPLAVVEAKDNNHLIGDGMFQAQEYASKLDVRFVFTSNGDGFLFYDMKTAEQKQISLDEFPSPEELFEKQYKQEIDSSSNLEKILNTPYYFSEESFSPRYYQRIAINRTVESIAKGNDRVLLVMATGTGKTYMAFQIIWRLWKSGLKKKILYLADRNILVDQTIIGDFKPFKNSMTKIYHKNMDTSYEIYLSLYQQLAENDTEDTLAILKDNFNPDFFDLIIVDECHRGSAREDSNWRKILDYFNNATKIGMTATPKETKEVSNIDYFGEPIYTYSLKDGIEDGYLAPYKVVRYALDTDVYGYRPNKGKTDKEGELVEDREYGVKDFDRNLVIDERTQLVAEKITEYLKSTDRLAKTIVFCVDIDHAERMRQALVNLNQDLCAGNHKYIMRITGDNDEGKKQLDYFIDNDSAYPTIVTTSKLMTTGVNCQTCKNIVLDNIFGENGMTEFKQIIGRGTRIKEDYDKMYFTILDFRNATRLFADPNFNGPDMQSEEYDPENFKGKKKVVIDPEEPKEVEPKEGKKKVYVNDVEVTLISERVQYYDKDGKLVTESLKDFTRKNILQDYASLDDFLALWTSDEKHSIIIEELANKGIFIDELRKLYPADVDDFDLICDIAYGIKPLTKSERAKNLKVNQVLDAYSDKCKQILQILLDKYSNDEIDDITDSKILKLPDFNEYGSPMKIASLFGGLNGYLNAVHQVQNALYCA
jgi:type I restriction enzyme R subunit